jgi:alkanesulfonate monooxygenase SsuD/methylene tetrahydromethanopterin reductase-like flavin-dependent oxidoreductase (luciferase family)
VDAETARSFPNVAVGTPSELVDLLEKRIEKLGIDAFVCTFMDTEMMHVFATEVMPHLNPVHP